MEPKDKIMKILNDFGMTGVKAAEAMSISVNTFNQKKAPTSLRHTFNEKNYQDLISYIKDLASKL